MMHPVSQHPIVSMAGHVVPQHGYGMGPQSHGVDPTGQQAAPDQEPRKHDISEILQQIMNITDQSLDEAQARYVARPRRPCRRTQSCAAVPDARGLCLRGGGRLCGPGDRPRPDAAPCVPVPVRSALDSPYSLTLTPESSGSERLSAAFPTEPPPRCRSEPQFGSRGVFLPSLC